MKKMLEPRQDEALQWLYSKSREFPLLTAKEEKDIDRSKWQALQRLQLLYTADDCYRSFLFAWTKNLLQNPPDPKGPLAKEHLNLLRREQGQLARIAEKRELLEEFQLCMSGAQQRAKEQRILTEIEVPPALVAGMAELFLAKAELRSIACALYAWQGLWPDADKIDLAGVNDSKRNAIAARLNEYNDAREALVNHNLRLVFSVAGRAPTSNLPYRDLIQEGVLGLMRAAEKFREDRGYRFSTYAYNWVSQAVRKAARNSGGILRYPDDVNDQVARLYRARMEHIQRYAREPDVKTLSKAINMSVEQVESLRQLTNLGISIDSPSRDHEDASPLLDSLAGGPFTQPSYAAEQSSLHNHLKACMGELSSVQRNVIELRWGLDTGLPLSRAEIAVQMSVSQEWVRQLEGTALARLSQDHALRTTYTDHIQECE